MSIHWWNYKMSFKKKLSFITNFWFIIPGVLLILISTYKYGPGIDVDGTYYVLLGKNLASHGNLLNFDKAIQGVWPPLFPLIIALFKIAGFDVIKAIMIFNFCLFSGTLILAYFTLIQFITDKRIIFFFMMTVLFSFPVFSIFTKVLSEGLFVFLTTALIYLTIKISRSFNIRYLLWLIVIMTLIQIDRYPGVFINLLAILYLIYSYRRERKILIKLLWAGISGFLAIGLWTARNYFVIHKPIALHPDIAFSRITNYGYNSIIEWILPRNIPPMVRITILVCLILICTIILFFHRRLFKPIMFLPLIFASYSLAITLLVPPNIMEYRFQSPVFIPFLATLYIIWDKENSRIIKLVLALCILSVFINQFVTTSLFTAFRYSYGGGGYNTEGWHNSELARYLKNHHIKDTVYSNDIAAVQYFNEDFAGLLQDSFIDISLAHYKPHISSSGCIVLFNNKERNIHTLYTFNFGPMKKIVQKALTDTTEKNNSVLRMPDYKFLEKFSAIYNLSYYDSLKFSDGKIYCFKRNLIHP
jgi:hypothetical protein